MKENQKILKEIKDEVSLKRVSGAGGYNPGPAMIWGGIMDYIRPCAWPGGFYGPSNLFPNSGVCTRR